jgi:NAD(P)H-nitrite reductase large subunit
MGRKKRVVIIGNSAAGISALVAFRRKDPDSEVVMIDREPVCAYSRVIIPYYVMGALQKEEALFLRTEKFYQEQGVRTLFGSAVEAVDSRTREVIMDHGRREPFDLLLIATGASPNRPRIGGVPPEDLLVLRSLADARRLKAMKVQAKTGVFLGAGLVTLQTLQAMHRPGIPNTLVLKSDRVLSQTLDAEGAAMIERRLVEVGIRVRKGGDVLGLGKGIVSHIAVLDSGDQVPADFLFAGKGVRPNVEFLQGSGIQVQNGVLVDSYLETNVEGIYAAGDAAQAPDFFSGQKVNYGLWPAAVEQGELAGKNMAGARISYPGNLKMNVSRIFAIPIVSIGDFGSGKVAEVLALKDENRHIYRKFCFDGKGILIGAILINRTEDLGVIHGLIRARKGVGYLKAHSVWKSPISYGLVYKNIRK